MHFFFEIQFVRSDWAAAFDERSVLAGGSLQRRGQKNASRFFLFSAPPPAPVRSRKACKNEAGYRFLRGFRGSKGAARARKKVRHQSGRARHLTGRGEGVGGGANSYLAPAGGEAFEKKMQKIGIFYRRRFSGFRPSPPHLGEI